MFMEINKDLQPEKLEEYSFLWSEARLVIAAAALFLGGVPPVWYLVPNAALFGTVSSLLTLAWIISGVASAYLLYRWNESGRTVFGGHGQKDQAAFFVSVVSGINLGLAGLLKKNIGMTISSNKLLFILVGLLYLVVAAYLYQRWSGGGRRLFIKTATAEPAKLK